MNQSNPIWRVGLCGTTERSVACATALANDPRWQVNWAVTPVARPIGRNQQLTATPVEIWARTQKIPVFNVAKSLRPLMDDLSKQAPVDFLLVVDFGYLVPDWLLSLPRLAPINVHPSALPKYRGSSPAQFVLLYGEATSAVTVMRMTAGMDEGPIIRALPFKIDSTETAASYYQKAFVLVAAQLADILAEYAAAPTEQAQPAKSTTPIARRLSRQDGYIPYSLLVQLQKGSVAPHSLNMYIVENLGPVLAEVLTQQPGLAPAVLIERAVRALSPWPGIWTIVPNYQSRANVRQKILAVHLESSEKLVVDHYQYEGERAV